MKDNKVDAELLPLIGTRVKKLGFLKRYPKTEEAFIGFCEGVSLLVMDQPHIFDVDHPNGWSLEQSLDWLISETIGRVSEFPSVLTLYEIYREKFAPRERGPIPEDVIDRLRWKFQNPGRSEEFWWIEHDRKLRQKANRDEEHDPA